MKDTSPNYEDTAENNTSNSEENVDQEHNTVAATSRTILGKNLPQIAPRHSMMAKTLPPARRLACNRLGRLAHDSLGLRQPHRRARHVRITRCLRHYMHRGTHEMMATWMLMMSTLSHLLIPPHVTYLWDLPLHLLLQSHMWHPDSKLVFKKVYVRQPKKYTDDTVRYAFLTSVVEPTKLSKKTTHESGITVFLYDKSGITAFMLIYVDDIILKSFSNLAILELLHHLGSKFSLKDLGYLHYFLGLEVHKRSSGLLFNREK
jgi:hypothetical protein